MATITIEEDFLSDRVTVARDGVEMGFTEPDITAPAACLWPVYSSPGGGIVAAFPSRELAISHLRLMAGGA